MNRKPLTHAPGAVAVFLSVLWAALVAGCSPSAGAGAVPEVLAVGHSSVTVAWTSEEPYKGRVHYRAAGTAELESYAVETFAGSLRHEVTVRGLHPATRYSYRLDDSETRYQFQTQPLASTPFSFLLVYGDVSKDIAGLVVSELSEFVLAFDVPRSSAPVKDPYAAVRPYVPVYDLRGVSSPYLRGGEAEPGDGPWSLDWGGLRLVVTDCLEASESETYPPALRSLGAAEAAHTFGVVCRSTLPQPSQDLAVGPLHSAFVSHNEINRDRPVAFVVHASGDSVAEAVDGIWYLGVPSGGDGAVRFDVDVERVVATFLAGETEVVVKEPPLKQKLTCEECRRLADKGAYEESVAAYEAFIENNEGHYQIDDAYFAIGEIYDEKLFRFPAAIDWYERLIEHYPTSSLVPLAAQRLNYLSAYADYDWLPLARFERIKKVEIARAQGDPEKLSVLFADVRSILEEYPDAAIAPVMLYWLANQHRLSDADKAAAAYRELADRYPEFEASSGVFIEIGETYYDAHRYREAIVAYRRALEEDPDKAAMIETQIGRSSRNMMRSVYAGIGWACLAALFGYAAVRKPRGLTARAALPVGIVLVVVAGVCGFAAWLIHEQFSSTREMVLLVVLFSLSAAVGTLVSRTISWKVNLGIGRSALAAAAGVLSFLAGTYLALFYVNWHFLIVFGL